MKIRSALLLAVTTVAVGTAAWMQPWTPSGIAPAQASDNTPPELEDLVGGRATQGEVAFRERGYVAARYRGLTAHWWHAASHRCVRSVTAKGLYHSVDAVPPGQCGMM
ncbi:hypothetical protein GXW78_15715 [Roseomonas terrae]|uniref:Uncharacterized protein n=1 Tax=Neoroseomonas terrae TaxID=424799 RepID=A0ABS5EJC0_9PROT|nr:hypothetical protein [Neoroseomonas terrae]MBR0651119.1 hypothetical protein [Neoroseomonas terrae]